MEAKPIRGPRDKHPSGRPIQRRECRDYRYAGRNSDEPLSPGLRKRSDVGAIGFLANLTPEEPEDFYE